VVTTLLIAMAAMLLYGNQLRNAGASVSERGSAYTYVGQEIHPGLGYLDWVAMVMITSSTR